MSQDAEHPFVPRLQGAVFHLNTHEERRKVVEWAFDYRGDVTLELASRRSVCGYVFNRVADGPAPYLEMFQPGATVPLKVFFRDLHSIYFTGEDTARGHSCEWEDWIRKKRENKAT